MRRSPCWPKPAMVRCATRCRLWIRPLRPPPAKMGGQSADLMEQINVLLNAGHSPFSLARQMVRYLRNSLMARIDGEKTELLQISGDERARAARTALLFTEEELTRNLQIVLRTFDDLNYRQEQRFHLELGLLKLVHAQRLLPLEELLSGVTSGTGVRSTAPASAPRTASAPARPAPRPERSASPATPAAPSAASPISPFSPSSGGWNTGPSIKQSAPFTPIASVEPRTTMTSPIAEMQSPFAA